MSHRFGLRFQVIDRQALYGVRRRTELGAIPFDHISLGLASIDFLKHEKVLQDLERSKLGTQNAKGEQFAARFTPPEAKQIKEAIRSAGQSNSDWIRKALIAAADSSKTTS